MAIDELLNEHEQGERVRSWLRRNAGAMLAGLAVGLAIILGWQFWQGRQVKARMGEAQRYEALLDSAGADASKMAAGAAKFPANSMYGALARLQAAKIQVDSGQLTQAIDTLRAIKTQDAGMQGLVNIRLARLLVSAGKPAEALTLVKRLTSAAALEVQGDAQAKLGQPAEARASYTRALTTLEVGSPERTLVELKLADVGGALPSSAPVATAPPASTPAAAI